MTLKEMLEEYSNQDPFTDGKSIEEYITEFVQEKLKEQRRICADNALSYLDHNDNPCVSKGSILNSPEPEI